MPFKSKKQMKWMFANKPDMAKEWADKTPNISKLPVKRKDGGGIKSPTKEKSPIRKGKKRYAAQGGKPNTNLKKGQ